MNDLRKTIEPTASEEGDRRRLPGQGEANQGMSPPLTCEKGKPLANRKDSPLHLPDMDRERLTITLRGDLLTQVDAVIDGEKIRNRSHAIEVLLAQALRPIVNRAVVLAGGKGVKMRPFTYEMPKTMLPVQGKPILEHIVERLRKAGIRHITIVVGHLGEKIRKHFSDGSTFGVHIDYFEQDGEIGTAYPLTKIPGLKKDGPFVVVYGDTLADIDVSDFFAVHQETGRLMTVALTSVADPGAFGIASLRGARVVGFEEKPGSGKGRSKLISAGLFLCNADVVGLVPKRKNASIESDVLPHLAGEGQLAGYPFEGKWFDVGTPEIYEKVIQEWKESVEQERNKKAAVRASF